MQRRLVCTVLFASLTAIGLVGLSSAALASRAVVLSPSSGTLLTLIHDCHNSYKMGYVSQWNVKRKHKHVGSQCSPKGIGSGDDEIRELQRRYPETNWPPSMRVPK